MWQPVLGLWLVCGAAAISVDLLEPKSKETAIRVECHGKIRHGVVAIGGETTGTTITFQGMTWELKLPDEASRKFAQEHHKQPIVVAGSLRKVRGTARPERWIVEVDRMTPRDAAAQPESALVKVTGMLRKQAAANGGPQTLSIEADEISWPLDLTAEKPMQAKAESMVGKPAVLEGRLTCGSNHASPTQPIIQVQKLETATAGPSGK